MGLFGSLFGGKTAETTIKVNYDGKKANDGLKGLKKTITTVVSAYAIKQTVEFGTKLALLGATAKSVDESFQKFSRDRGRDYDDMMTKLRKATMGTVKDMELQQKAMQAMLSGVSFDDVIVAMDYVTRYAMTTGTDVSQKMTTVMTGLARGSAQFMDDVGIQVMGASDVVGATIDQMKEKMSQFNVSQDDAAVKAATFKARLENIRIELGRNLVPALDNAIQFLNKMIDGMNFLFRGKGTTRFSKQQQEMAKTGKELIEINKKIAFLEAQKANFATRYYITDKKTGREKNISQHEYKAIQMTNMEQAARLGKEELKMIDLISKKNKLLKKAVKHRKDGLDVIKRSNKKAVRAPVEKEKKGKAREPGVSPEVAYELIKLEMVKDAKKAFLQKQQEHSDQVLEAEQLLINTEIALMEEGKDKQIAILNEKYYAYEQAYAGNKEALKIIAQAKNLELEQLEQQHQDKLIQQQQEAAIEKSQIMFAMFNSVSQITSAMIGLSDTYTQRELRNIQKMNVSQERKDALENNLRKKAMERQKAFMRVQQGLAISKAVMDTTSAALGVFSATPGELIMKTLAMTTALATGMLQVAKIEAQHFQYGKKGKQHHRSADMIPALIGPGETVVDAPASAKHSGALEAIANNTADTASGLHMLSRSVGGGGSNVYNFYGLSAEQLAKTRQDVERRNYVGDII